MNAVVSACAACTCEEQTQSGQPRKRSEENIPVRSAPVPIVDGTENGRSGVEGAMLTREKERRALRVRHAGGTFASPGVTFVVYVPARRCPRSPRGAPYRWRRTP
eukprot:1181426-Prorocentrum_minimum.AAC.7